MHEMYQMKNVIDMPKMYKCDNQGDTGAIVDCNPMWWESELFLLQCCTFSHDNLVGTVKEPFLYYFYSLYLVGGFSVSPEFLDVIFKWILIDFKIGFKNLK